MTNKEKGVQLSPAPIALGNRGTPTVDSHYASSLPQWRFAIRQLVIPLVRAEASNLASLQSRWRTPLLDTYFAITANLGTHTFYMIVLPIFFWFGYGSLGRAMVHILAIGVCASGFLKDLLCLPRPPSPPLQRITMSGHVSLEYGFPSTHATNAVSVAAYAIIATRLLDAPLSFRSQLMIEICMVLYVLSIVIGRLYCGMHGFLDVITGSILGAFLGITQYLFEKTFNTWASHCTIIYPLSVTLFILLFIRLHPEPVDDCPCFDDSVAFAAVISGVEMGSWQQKPLLASLVSFHVLGNYNFPLVRAILRVSLGVLIIFAWRSCMKSILLRQLPPVFRSIERVGLALPRKFFVRATQYQKVPEHLNDNDVIPSAGEIPSMFSSLRHARRRAISIGPQSMADAYETIELFRRREQDSASSADSLYTSSQKADPWSEGGLDFHVANTGTTKNLTEKQNVEDDGEVNEFSIQSSPTRQNVTSDKLDSNRDTGAIEKKYRKVFSQLEKPRVRYDVEVVTKIIIYSGIGWLAVYFVPDFFEAIGISAESL